MPRWLLDPQPELTIAWSSNSRNFEPTGPMEGMAALQLVFDDTTDCGDELRAGASWNTVLDPCTFLDGLDDEDTLVDVHLWELE